MRLLDTLSLAVIVVPTKSLRIESPSAKRPERTLNGAMKAGKQWRTHLLPQLRPTSHNQTLQDDSRGEESKPCKAPPVDRTN